MVFISPDSNTGFTLVVINSGISFWILNYVKTLNFKRIAWSLMIFVLFYTNISIKETVYRTTFFPESSQKIKSILVTPVFSSLLQPFFKNHKVETS